MVIKIFGKSETNGNLIVKVYWNLLFMLASFLFPSMGLLVPVCLLSRLYSMWIFSVKMVKEQRLVQHCPKTLQSGDNFTYAKQEVQADPLAYWFDRVPLSVEYITECKEWEQMNACSLLYHPGLIAAKIYNRFSSPLHFSSYLHEQISTSLPTMRQHTCPTCSSAFTLHLCLHITILNNNHSAV